MNFSAIIVAAGTGVRAGPGPAKQWRDLGGMPVLRWSAEALLRAGAVELIVVVRPRDQGLAQAALAGLSGWRMADGGVTRARSVASGLAALAPTDAVLIHDAARPLIPDGVVTRLLEALEGADGAIPALPITDTLKRANRFEVETTPREGLWAAQTPQAFRFTTIVEAYANIRKAAEITTDDAAVVEAAGGRVIMVPGDPRMMKLTYPEDFAMAQALVASGRTTRTGLGYDAHRFGPGEAVWLCGVRIAHSAGLIGHSDADAGLHALTDAVLGAIGAGDIGDHFPPSDPKWQGAASDVFLRHAAALVAERGGQIVNVDVTLICEAPQIAPYRVAMRERLAEILAIGVDRVSVKATTTEGMGFAGRGEGLAAQAIATVSIT